MNPSYHIRQAKTEDLAAIRSVCLRTSINGEDGSLHFDHSETLWAIYTDPYLSFSLETCFVLEDGLGLAGYSLASLDAAAMHAWAENEWLPPFRQRFPLRDKTARTEEDQKMVELIHQPFPLIPWISDYPSELHIDLLPRAQKQGQGRALLDALFTRLRALGSVGVHLGVGAENTNAQAFYHHIGFTDLFVFPDGARIMGYKFTPSN